MAKEKYVAPEMEIIEFDTEDVITTSSLVNGGLGGTPEHIEFTEIFK